MLIPVRDLWQRGTRAENLTDVPKHGKTDRETNIKHNIT